MIMCEKLPEEIREKIYTYAHPSFTKKQKDYIKLQTKINERKRFMAEYCLYKFEAFVKGEPINTELTYDELVSSINILAKCTCCKSHFSKSTKKLYLDALVCIILELYLKFLVKTIIIYTNTKISKFRDIIYPI